MLTYLDTSVALAHLLAEERHPDESLWRRRLISSRLLHYEAWNRLHARNLAGSHGEMLRVMLDHLAILELAPAVLARALEPFPAPTRTLDALHFASIEFLREQGLEVELASYDERMLVVARALGVPLAEI